MRSIPPHIKENLGSRGLKNLLAFNVRVRKWLENDQVNHPFSAEILLSSSQSETLPVSMAQENIFISKDTNGDTKDWEQSESKIRQGKH